MKKLIFPLVTFFVGMLCFILSFAFFMNSGILTDDFRMDEVRTVKVLRALDELPLVNFGSDEIEFGMWGIVESVDDNEVTLKDYYDIRTFYFENSSGIEVGNRVGVLYGYDENGSIFVKWFKKILEVEDVKDYESCVEYGGEKNYDFPRNCTLGQVTFIETSEELGKKCEFLKGIWLEEFDECEGISEGDCYDLGGEYFECESVCRNDPDAEICNMMCVQVCKF